MVKTATLGLMQKRFTFLNIAQCAREVTLDEYNKKDHVYLLKNLSQQHHEMLEKEMDLDRRYYFCYVVIYFSSKVCCIYARLYESVHASFVENATANGISLKSRECPSSLLRVSKQLQNG